MRPLTRNLSKISTRTLAISQISNKPTETGGFSKHGHGRKNMVHNDETPAYMKAYKKQMQKINELKNSKNPILHMAGEWVEVASADDGSLYNEIGYTPIMKTKMDVKFKIIDDHTFECYSSVIDLSQTFEFEKEYEIESRKIGKCSMKSWYNPENKHLYTECIIIEPHFWFLRNILKTGDRIICTWHYNEKTGFMDTSVVLNNMHSKAMTSTLMQVLIWGIGFMLRIYYKKKSDRKK